jgi:hypothetical protein
MTRLPASPEEKQQRMVRSLSRRAVVLLALLLAMAGAYAAKAADAEAGVHLAAASSA